ncbi:lysophospholipid acyltransferase family protein [Fusobacterium sp. PH5-44]|uniref:lysophospholipid acyltransferase family protein n=1 Tax=unclassified Fusobacterium TaxID=2648384 RepID=UPI003D203A06
MITTILVLLTGLILFIFITIFYLPVVCILEEKKSVALARKAIGIVSLGVTKSVGMKLEVVYEDKAKFDEIDKTKGVIYICNHQSNLDIPAIICGMENHDVGFVAKKEMKSWPFYGFWMKRMQCVFLDRKNPREGIKDMKKAVEVIKKGYPTLIFPEGERTLTGQIGEFKKGSFKLALDTKGIIVPLSIKGTFDIQKKGESVMRRGKIVKLFIGNPIHVENMERAELKELDKKVHEIVVKNYNSL